MTGRPTTVLVLVLGAAVLAARAVWRGGVVYRFELDAGELRYLMPPHAGSSARSTSVPAAGPTADLPAVPTP